MIQKSWNVSWSVSFLLLVLGVGNFLTPMFVYGQEVRGNATPTFTLDSNSVAFPYRAAIFAPLRREVEIGFFTEPPPPDALEAARQKGAFRFFQVGGFQPYVVLKLTFRPGSTVIDKPSLEKYLVTMFNFEVKPVSEGVAAVGPPFPIGDMRDSWPESEVKFLSGFLQEGAQVKGAFSREGLYDMPLLQKAYSWDFEFDEPLPAPPSSQ